MQVHARFSITETARQYYWQAPGQANRVKLQAVKGEPFGSATPSGNVDMLIVNPEAAAVFLNAPIGAEFDVVFTLRTPEE